MTIDPCAARPRRRRAVRAGALLATLGALCLAGCASRGAGAAPSPPPAPAAAPPSAPAPASPGVQTVRDDVADARDPLALAARARHYQDHGEYAAALAEWRRLRPRVPADGDLELTIAIDEARSGQLDSAATRLSGRLLSAAADDSLPVTRYRLYPPSREATLVNGAFDGWHWYVWRARAEVAAARGRWAEATAAARRCVAARPLDGKQWLLLAVCAGRAGQANEARAAARQSVLLDGGVPETHYLDGLWAWKDGRRAEAQARFGAAVSLDSTFSPGVLALIRSRLPGVAPDSLPGRVLTGAREAGMLTSRATPKIEDRRAADEVPIMASHAYPVMPDSLKAQLLERGIRVWLLVDEDGRVALTDLPWYRSGNIPVSYLSELMSLLSTWQFRPAQVQGTPRATWTEIRYVFPR